jgi:hypothetical protein
MRRLARGAGEHRPGAGGRIRRFGRPAAGPGACLVCGSRGPSGDAGSAGAGAADGPGRP